MIDLYYLMMDSADWSPDDEVLMNCVTEQRRKRILSYRFDKDRKLSLYAALLLPLACKDCFSVSPDALDIVWLKEGKPYLNSHTGIHFSLSHSGNCAALAISDSEIGLDVEEIRTARQSVIRRAFTADETERICHSDDSDREFFSLWTRKEAYAKYLGTGLTEEVFHTSTLLSEHDSHLFCGILTETDSVESDIDTDQFCRSYSYSIYGEGGELHLRKVSPGELRDKLLQNS